MYKTRKILVMMVMLSYALGLFDLKAEMPPFRSIPGKGAESKTLLIYSKQGAPYSLLKSLESLACQLRRVKTELYTVSILEATSSMIEESDYIVVFIPNSNPILSEELLTALAKTSHPVL